MNCLVNLDGLRQALERYNDSGKSGSCGSWDIHSGGYDKWWEACYDRTPVFSCEASGEYDSRGHEYGYLFRDINLPDKMFKEICDMVHSEFPECRMAPQEQEKVQESELSQVR